MELQAVLQEIVSESSSALFSEFTELSPTDVGPNPSLPGYLGTIGFVGPEIRGGIVWEVSADTAKALVGLGPDIEEAVIRDWVGEMANQLLGRVKNKLLNRSLVLQMSLPLVIQGCSLQVSASQGPHVIATFMTPHGPFRVIADCIVGPDFVMAEASTATADVAEEGSAFLF